MTEIGKAITGALAFAAKAGKECEALAQLITVEISDLFRSTSLGSVYLPEKWSSSFRDVGWVRTDAAWSLPLTRREENQPGAHLAFQMSFLCDNPAGGWSDEPILYVNFWDEPTDVKNGEYMGFQMYGIAPLSIRRLQQGTARLFRWETDTGAADRWTFGIRLAEINGLDDIRRLITGPLTQLLANIDDAESALDQLNGIVTYTAVDEMPDYYRVAG
jgi:hypothetical protein